jgi:hypothetical protein
MMTGVIAQHQMGLAPAQSSVDPFGVAAAGAVAGVMVDSGPQMHGNPAAAGTHWGPLPLRPGWVPMSQQALGMDIAPLIRRFQEYESRIFSAQQPR